MKKLTKEERLWNYLIKRCDTSYEARLVFRAVMRIYGQKK